MKSLCFIIHVGIVSFNKFASSGSARSVPIQTVKSKIFTVSSCLIKNLNSLILIKTVHRRPPSLEARIFAQQTTQLATEA